VPQRRLNMFLSYWR